jgi:hypothetical protein
MHQSAALPRQNIAFAYLLMLGGAIGLFFLIRAQGEHLVAPASPVRVLSSGAPRAATDSLLHVLLALVAVIVLSRALGWLLGWLRQPPVVGEIIAGIMLGPSLLGHLMPEASTFLFPSTIRR